MINAEKSNNYGCSVFLILYWLVYRVDNIATTSGSWQSSEYSRRAFAVWCN